MCIYCKSLVLFDLLDFGDPLIDLIDLSLYPLLDFVEHHHPLSVGAGISVFECLRLPLILLVQPLIVLQAALQILDLRLLTL